MATVTKSTSVYDERAAKQERCATSPVEPRKMLKTEGHHMMRRQK
jgi:hypothetical protein